MKHTPEPWEWVGDTLCHYQTEVLKAGDDGKSYGLHSAELQGDNLDADKDRIVSCINNCSGINPEAVPEMVKALEAYREAFADGPENCGYARYEQVDEQAAAALAKAKEGQL